MSDPTTVGDNEGPGLEPDVPDQTDLESFSDPDPDVPEGDVDVSDIEEGPDDGLESISRLQRPSVSVARARSHTSGFSGQCLHFVWRCLDGQHKYGLPDANAAFRASRHLSTTGTPPAGVPVYFLGSKHGHVALSVGGGRIRSTDWPSRNRIGEVEISVLAKAWGRRYAGWAADMAGHRIPGTSGSKSPAAKLVGSAGRGYPGKSTTRGARGPAVSAIQSASSPSVPTLPTTGASARPPRPPSRTSRRPSVSRSTVASDRRRGPPCSAELPTVGWAKTALSPEPTCSPRTTAPGEYRAP